MKLVLLVALLALACANPTPTPAPDGGGGFGFGGGGGFGGVGGFGGFVGGSFPTCTQERVASVECTSPSDAGFAVLRKEGVVCASCSAVDSSGQPTPQPIGCRPVPGGDLCVAACGECS